MVYVGKARELSAFQMLGRFLNFVDSKDEDIQIEESKHQVDGDFISLKNGFSSLTNKIRDDFDVQFDFEVKSIHQEADSIYVNDLQFDYVISAIGAASLQKALDQ